MVEAGGRGCGLGVASEGGGQSGVTPARFAPGGWGSVIDVGSSGGRPGLGEGEARECSCAHAAFGVLKWTR